MRGDFRAIPLEIASLREQMTGRSFRSDQCASANPFVKMPQHYHETDHLRSVIAMPSMSSKS